MAVSYNQNLGVWQVNGRGAYSSQAEAAAAESGGSTAPAPANQVEIDPKQFTGAPQPGAPTAPMDRAPQRTAPQAPAQQPYVAGYVGGRPNQNQAVTYTEQSSPANWAERVERQGYGATSGRGTGGSVQVSGGTRGMPASPAAAGIAPPQNVQGDPGMAVPDTAGPPPQMQIVDRTQYDQAAQGLQKARDDFYNELNRLSGVDPFGNQAFLQKATDRAVAQASGSAAMARGGAAAMAGAQRQAVGVQAQTAARGTQDVAEQARRDAIQAAQLRVQTVGGIGDVNSQLASNELALIDKTQAAAEQNLRAYLGGRELDQAEKESLRRLSTAVAQIDMQRYQTDVAYRENVNNNLTAMYASDNNLKGVREQISAQENLSGGDFVMGLLGAGAGLASALVTSDRRAKFNVHDPDARDLADFLGNTKGKLYHYKEPNKPGRKPGLNFGPMAQDLAKSRIGATVVVKQKDGTLGVDAARLALADHAALAELAREVEKLKRRGAKGGGK